MKTIDAKGTRCDSATAHATVIDKDKGSGIKDKNLISSFVSLLHPSKSLELCPFVED